MSKQKNPVRQPAARPQNPTVAARPKISKIESSQPLTHFFQPNFWRENWLPCLVLMAFSFVLYSQAIFYGYVLDDQIVIWDNIYVQKGFGGIREIFAYDSFMGFFKEQKFLLEGGRYRPLSLATFAVENGIFGKDKPGISHFINLVLYGATGILLYRLLLGLFPRRENGQWFFGLAFVAALIFVLHPLHSEVVANIKGRDEIFALFFSLAAWYATMKFFDKQKNAWLVASGLFFLLALYSKENSITFLAVIPLSMWFFSGVPKSSIFKITLPLLVATAIFLVSWLKATGYLVHESKSNDLMNNPFLGMVGGEKMATIFLTLGWYLKLFFAPFPLTHDYYPYHVPKVNWSDWKALGSLVFYAAIGFWSVWKMFSVRKNEVFGIEKTGSETSDSSIIAFSILYYLTTLSIVSNIFVGVGTFMNERFLFMPSVGFCLLAGWFLTRKIPNLLNEPAEKPYILGLGILTLIILGSAFVVIKRVPDWQSALTLNGSAVKNSPESCRAHSFYATALYKEKYLLIRDKKDPAMKEEIKTMVETMSYHINKALEIHPKYGAALTMKSAIAAAVFEQDKQLDKLFHEFDIVLDELPNNTNIRDFVGQYMKYLKSTGTNPNKFAAFCHRRGYEFYWKEKKDVKSALEFLNYALDQKTEDTRILEDLAEIYLATGNVAKAAEMRQRAEISKNM